MAARNGAPPGKLPMSGPRICTPFVGPLTLTRKAFGLSVGDYKVTDANGAVVLRVKHEFFTSRRRRIVLDAAGRILLTLRAKVNINILYVSRFSCFGERRRDFLLS